MEFDAAAAVAEFRTVVATSLGIVDDSGLDSRHQLLLTSEK